jgi:steroid 5-alpha reductase family enzyme
MASLENNKIRQNMAVPKKRSIIIIAVALAITAFVVIGASQGGGSFGGYPVILLCAILAYGINWLAFVPANIFQTEKFYDLTGSITYLSVIFVALFLTARFDDYSILMASMVVIWALRLGSFLFIRVIKDGADNRFDDIKPDFLRFLATWTLQALWVVVAAAPALVAIASSHPLQITTLAWVGLAVWLFGFSFEVIADHQKRVFRTAHPERTTFIKTGLWAYSRHPNYFGEITLWFGISIAAIPALQGWQFVTLISPIFVMLLLTKLSGVPMLEAKAEERWKDDEDYQAYKANTPILWPKIK